MRENKEINLLPCPFCGGEASVVRTREESYGYWQAAYAVGCKPCNILLGHFEQAEFILGKGYVNSYKKRTKDCFRNMEYTLYRRSRMKKSGFTPAPWHIERKERSGFIESIGPCVADGYAGSVWLEVPEEDALLISAAPELLEALQLLLREMEDSGNAGSEDYGWPLAISKSLEVLEKVGVDGS